MAEASHREEGLRARLEGVRLRVARAAQRVGRDAREVTLIAVSKTHPTPLLGEAIAAGATDFGENRVQEAESKIEELGRDAARWHLIGHLQANKARRAVKLFDLLHTVDTPALVARLERLCVEEERASLDVLVQVDLAGEATKSGATPAELDAVLDALAGCTRLRCRGLMMLPPFFEDVERVRPYFRRLRSLRDELAERGRLSGEVARELSMGMSHDFEVAIEEGATMVRVGTAIFGARGKV